VQNLWRKEKGGKKKKKRKGGNGESYRRSQGDKRKAKGALPAEADGREKKKKASRCFPKKGGEKDRGRVLSLLTRRKKKKGLVANKKREKDLLLFPCSKEKKKGEEKRGFGSAKGEN